MLEHAGCISVAGVEWSFSLFICHQCLAVYFLFFPQGNKKLNVALVRIHNQNEIVVLFMLYMACVSGIVLYTICFFLHHSSCLAKLSCWSQRVCSLGVASLLLLTVSVL